MKNIKLFMILIVISLFIGFSSVSAIDKKEKAEVKVPDTALSNSSLITLVGMFDIALGIGMVMYVKKNKTAE